MKTTSPSGPALGSWMSKNRLSRQCWSWTATLGSEQRDLVDQLLVERGGLHDAAGTGGSGVLADFVTTSSGSATIAA